MRDIEAILKPLEAVARGKPVDERLLLEEARNLYHWAALDLPATGTEGRSEEDREAAVAATIQLYNKARLVAAPTLLEAKIYLKAAAAWMLTVYGGLKFKSLVACIRLHCRAAAELMLHFESDSEAAVRSLRQAVENWGHVNNQALERMVSVAELEELRVCMFHCFVSQGRLLVRARGAPRDLQAAVAGAMELAQHLPALRLSFAQHAVDVGYYLAAQGFTMDGMGYFSRALTVLDLLEQSEEVPSEEREHLKIKANLSLAYLYSELNKFDSALSCIERGAAAHGAQPELILFARFAVACRHGEPEPCRNYAMRLVGAGASFPLALHTLNMFCGCVSDLTAREQLYASMLESFPEDPEYTATRLCHLRLTVTSFRQEPSFSAAHSGVALELGESILLDHLSGRHSLDDGSRVAGEALTLEEGGQLSLLRRILLDRAAWSKTVKDWVSAVRWVDLFLMLSDDAQCGVSATDALLNKADLLLQLDRREEALKLSHDLAQREYAPSTVSMVFKCALRARIPSEAAHIVVSTQRKHIMMATSNRPEEYSPAKRLADLDVLLTCCQEAYAEQGATQCRAILDLLEEWIQQCVTHQLWRETQSGAESGVPQASLLGVLFEYMQLSIVCHAGVESVPQANRPTTPSLQEPMASSKHPTPVAVDVDDAAVEPHEEGQLTATDVGRRKRKLSGSIVDGTAVKSPKLSHTTFVEEKGVGTRCIDEYFSSIISCGALRCDMVVWNLLADRTRDVLILYSAEHQEKGRLGEECDLQRIADLSWNLGKAFFEPPTDEGQVADRLLLSSSFFEVASLGYSLISHNASTVGVKNRVLCLLAALAERLDADYFMQRGVNPTEESTIRENRKLMSEHLRELRGLSSPPVEGNGDDTALWGIFTMLEISARCRGVEAGGSLADFVTNNEGLLLTLSPSELEMCSDICSAEPRGTAEVSRRLLLLAVQRCVQQEVPEWGRIAGMYKRIIKISTSRHEALSAIESFEQLLLPREGESVFSTSETGGSGVNPADVDEICVTAYNWGVTLMELSQYVLAEKFISKALHLLGHTTRMLLTFHETIKESYSVVLGALSGSKAVESHSLLSGIQDIETGLRASSEATMLHLAKADQSLSSKCVT